MAFLNFKLNSVRQRYASRKPLDGVATDLENLEKSGNLKETSEIQGFCLKSQGFCLKSQGIRDRIPKVREFFCLKFVFSQAEDPNFENFLGEHAARPP